MALPFKGDHIFGVSLIVVKDDMAEDTLMEKLTERRHPDEEGDRKLYTSSSLQVPCNSALEKTPHC